MRCLKNIVDLGSSVASAIFLPISFILWLWHVLLWSNQLCIQILSFSYPRHPSNSSSSSSFLQPQLLQIHLSPANLTTAIHFILASHKQTSTNFNAFKIHWHVSLQTLQNINISHQHSKNYIGFLSDKESITKSVFSHTKHLQINNLHISTIVFHFRHILFPHDLLIHLFFPFHMSDHHLAKELSLSSVHDSGILSLLIPETHPLYQYSVPGSKHIFSKLLSLPRLFPISLDCLPGFLILAILILCPIEWHLVLDTGL